MGKIVVSALKLGHMGYSRALKLQQQCACKLLETTRKGQVYNTSVGTNKLLLVEHYPVYTIGLRTKDYTEKDEQRLRSLGAEFFKTNRGGLITFHGLGQLVAYPVVYLRDFQMGMRHYIAALERTLIRVCKSYGIEAHTSSDGTGIWVGQNKLAAIGVHGSRYVTTHGIGLNCNTDLAWFDHIVPCGIEDRGVTSLSAILNREITVDETMQPFLEAFATVFNCDIQMETLNDLGIS